MFNYYPEESNEALSAVFSWMIKQCDEMIAYIYSPEVADNFAVENRRKDYEVRSFVETAKEQCSEMSAGLDREVDSDSPLRVELKKATDAFLKSMDTIQEEHVIRQNILVKRFEQERPKYEGHLRKFKAAVSVLIKGISTGEMVSEWAEGKKSFINRISNSSPESYIPSDAPGDLVLVSSAYAIVHNKLCSVLLGMIYPDDNIESFKAITERIIAQNRDEREQERLEAQQRDAEYYAANPTTKTPFDQLFPSGSPPNFPPVDNFSREVGSSVTDFDGPFGP